MCSGYREHKRAMSLGSGLSEEDRDEMNAAFYGQLAKLVEARSKRDNMLVFDMPPANADESSETIGAEDSFSEEEDAGDEEGDEGGEEDEGDEGGEDDEGDEDDEDDTADDLDPDEGRVAQPGSSGERGSFVLKICKSKGPSEELTTPDFDGVKEVEAFVRERSICDNTIREDSVPASVSRGINDDSGDISDMDITDIPEGNGNLLSGEPGLEELLMKEGSGQQEMSVMDLMLPANKDPGPEGNR